MLFRYKHIRIHTLYTLTSASDIIEKRAVFIGTINCSVVHPRKIFSNALTDKPAEIIFVHNHPENDVDHIIMTKNEHFNFQSEGLLEI